MLVPTVFVDCGGNDCAGVKKYLSKMRPFDKVYVFEPNPVFNDSYQGSEFTLIKKAVWTEDGILPFYVSKDDRQIGSSLLENKLCKVAGELKPFWHDACLMTECVDLGAWLKKLPPCHLTLKLDIEGAEYPVLWKMVRDESIKLVSKLYVEFHDDTMKITPHEHVELLDAIQACGIDVYYWD
jgi:FkbM family methyltransferase